MSENSDESGGGDSQEPAPLQENKPASTPVVNPAQPKPSGPPNTEFHTFLIDRFKMDIDKDDG